MSEQPANPFNNNLPNQIGAICNAIDKTPRVVQCIQACNEEKLIEACMLQLYNQVDKIIVIEGAVQNKVNAEQATTDGRSLDRTVEIIKDVKANKDPDKKIVFVQIDRPWLDLEEIKNTFFQYMQDGDWMLITDADEFIHPEVIDQLREAISLEPWATEFVPAGFYHFWRDAHHIRRPSGDWGQQHQRFIKFQPGLNYVNHPVARDAKGRCTYFDQYYLFMGKRFVLPSFVIYHYSYCRDNDEDIKKKKVFYEKELGQGKHGSIGAYARGGQTDEYINREEDMDTILTFDGDHPPIMEGHPMIKNVDPFLKGKTFDGYRSAAPYCLERIPLVWAYTLEGRPGFDQIFNTVDV
jgi:hypothetical protein